MYGENGGINLHCRKREPNTSVGKNNLHFWEEKKFKTLTRVNKRAEGPEET